MSQQRLAALALAAAALAVAGCGGAAKSSSQTAASSSSPPTTTAAVAPSTHTPPLSRAQLIARADLICKRVNAKRASVKITSPEAYERLFPPLSAYELAAVAQMRTLTPPAAMAQAWKRIVDDNQTIGEVTGHFAHYSEASSLTIGHKEDGILTRATNDLFSITKREGFKDCARA